MLNIRLFKDKRNIYKIISFIVFWMLIMIILNCIGTVAKAEEYPPEGYEYYIRYRSTKNIDVKLYTRKPVLLKYTSDNPYRYYIVSENTDIDGYIYNESTDEWDYYNNTYLLDGYYILTKEFGSFPVGFIKTNDGGEEVNIYESNYDVYRIDGNVFFSPPLPPLRKALQNQNLLQNLILPLRGLIPYLIGFLILLVAFWKAWQFLLQQLRTG